MQQKTRWLDERFKRFRGYVQGKSITLARRADNFYRKALDTQIALYIQKVIDDIERDYDSVIENKQSAETFARTFEYWGVAMLAVLLGNTEKIANKWLNIVKEDVSKSVQKSILGFEAEKLSAKYINNDNLRLILHRNVQLIRNASTQTLTNIENILYDGVIAREKWRDIKKELMHQKEVGRKRIKTIARDQTAKAREAINRQEQEALGIEYFKWVTVGDERVSKEHRKLNGKIYKWGDVAERLPVIDSYGNVGYPSDRVNCFTGDTLVSLDFGLQKLYKREYSGLINVIKTDTGRLVRATPNHPFLTQRGWVRANELNSSDYIVNVKPFLFNVDDGNKQQIEFSELFDSFSLFGFTCAVSGASFQFHGDGVVNKDVNIIDIDSLLSNNRMSKILECLCKFYLSKADMVCKTAFFSLLRFMLSLGLSEFATSQRFISFECDFLSLVNSEFTHSDEVSLTSIAKFNTILNKYSIDDTSRDFEFLGKSQNTHSLSVERANFIVGQSIYCVMRNNLELKPRPLKFITDGSSFDIKALGDAIQGSSGLIFLDKVKDNIQSEFTGHVYNLQNEYGYYTVNKGFVNHNCRCSAIAVIIKDGYKTVWDNDSYKVVKK